MPSHADPSSTWLHALRLRAETALRDELGPGADRHHPLDELHVHEVELRLQNDELRQTKEQLERLVARQRAHLDRAPIGQVRTDETGRVLEANRVACALFGLAEREVVGHELAGLVDLADAWAVHGQLQRARAFGVAPAIDVRVRDHAGAMLDLRLETCRIEGPGTDVSCVTALVDLTGRRATQRYRDIAEGAPVETLVVDGDGIIVHANAAAHALLGLAAPALFGVPWSAVVPGVPVGQLVEGTGAGTGRAEAEVVAAACPAGLAVEVAWRIERPSAGPPMTIVVLRALARPGRDARAAPQAAAEPAEALARALEASAAKSEILGIVSHELRTPLNGVLGFAQLLGRVTPGQTFTPAHQRMVDNMLRGGEQVVRVLDDLLDFARIEAGKLGVSLASVSLDGLLEEVAQLLEPAGGEANVAVHPGAKSGLVVVADRGRLKQILLNLGSNGVKYNRPGGVVSFSAVGRADRVRIAVTDDGRGISGEHRLQIFEPFDRGDQDAGAVRGVGLGLAISRRLVEAMHGMIGLADAADAPGTTFWVELPSAPP